MELKLENGRYCPRVAGGFAVVTGAEETAQRLLMRLSARRGGFFPLPDYGSELYALGRCKPSQRQSAARRMVYEALAEEKSVSIEEVRFLDRGSGLGAVTVSLRLAGGETASLTVETGGAV